MIRRTKTNGFDIKDSVSLETLENIVHNGGVVTDFLRPLDIGLGDIPVAILEMEDVQKFKNGRLLPYNGNGLVKVYSDKIFIGIAQIEENILKPKRIINVNK
jgi:tRNA U55 pseudouridine synthase TruB